ncbi:MAG: HAD family hydrolase [Lachnospiraceae bacterium]|nr:HAD family hydrolase [Lachnospiraceae bacterium]
MKTRNYIFDLYGTLLDIRTNEDKASLWRELSKLYQVYGTLREPKELYKTYLKMDQEERKNTSSWNGSPTPEIRLEKVFARLLFSGEGDAKIRDCGILIREKTVDEWREDYGKDPEETVTALSKSEWAFFFSNAFRTLSREYVKPFDHTIRTLEKLKKKKKNVYLLSNAQRIFTYPEIEESGILPYFDGIFISSDYDRKKPDPLFMEELLKGTGIKKEESVLVGNEIESDVRCALLCGMNSIYLNTLKLEKKEIRQKIEAQLEETGASKKLAPKVIMDGDIGKIV